MDAIAITLARRGHPFKLTTTDPAAHLADTVDGAVDGLSASRRQFVVIDTAPTGHTLLLLDAAGSYHREMTRQLGETTHIRTHSLQLQDPAQTKVLIVTLAEPTPVLEAADLQADLERAGIHPWTWVVNNSLAAAHPVSPLLCRRAATEVEQLARVRELADRVAIVPLLTVEPSGPGRLHHLVEPASVPAAI